jgi:uncharacterized secreted protein with C-terminal beta-propeller domain
MEHKNTLSPDSSGLTSPAATVTGDIPQFSTQKEAENFIVSHTNPIVESFNVLTPDQGTLNDQQQIPGSATRTWQFDVDTSTYRPDEYLVTASAIIQDVTGTALFNVLDRPTGIIRIPQNGAAFAQSPDNPGYFIRIDPIPDHYIGEKFTITGTTNLPADAEMLVQVYSSSFSPTQKSQSGEFSGSTGTIRASGSSLPAPQPTAAPAPAAGRDYSTTNVQVRGVDEADIIKTDGTYIYVVTGNSLKILHAYPAKTATIISAQMFYGTPQSLYVNGDRLVLICSEETPVESWNCNKGSCSNYPPKKPKTRVFVYSVSDPAHPDLVREIGIDGYYKDSRMVGTCLYFVTTEAIRTSDGIDFPQIQDSEKGTSVLPVYYFDRKDREFSWTTVGAVDVRSDKPVKARTFLVGSAGTVYVSPTHLYIAIPTPGDYRNPDATSIYSFAIDEDRMTFTAEGSVDGTLLSQYSMDEYGGNLRVATTVQDYTSRTSSTYSKVSVLDDRLNVVGTVANIAPGERIYAARFLGERLYLVTFRETDPFFVIDLRNPERPKILGELHIPGFSSYLHPYDATHIIGIGMQSTRGGLKMALFDVADVRNPELVDEEYIGDYGSDSEVLDDPKAFLFDKEKDLLVLPVHIYEQQAYTTGHYQVVPPPLEWSGAMVYGVNPQKGFTQKGKVIHYTGPVGSSTEVKRSLYIEDTLYTMSPEKIVMSDLANKTSLIGEVRLTT